MTCSICKKPVILVPSAEERAKKYGETPAYYRSLFPNHTACVLSERKEQTSELMKRKIEEFNKIHHNHNLLVPNRPCG